MTEEQKTTNILDWEKLKAFVTERNPVEVYAGILNDWYWTAATVYKDGQYIEDHGAYTHSYWANPGFKAEMQNGDTIEVSASRKATAEEMQELKEKSDSKLHKLEATVAKLKTGKTRMTP
jgi:hypothetical protein